jgi:antibiotic biosynthesis monooxygenase (ABM) superfamily enzyme
VRGSWSNVSKKTQNPQYQLGLDILRRVYSVWLKFHEFVKKSIKHTPLPKKGKLKKIVV